MSPETSVIEAPSCTTAVILAGGLGTRLRSVVADKPKALASVSGRPFLEYVFDQLVEAGIKNAVICVGHLAEQIESHFGNTYRGIAISYSREKSLLGTAGALRYALELIKTDHLLILNGDSYTKFSFEDFARFHFAKGAKASMLLTRVPDARRYGQVKLDAQQHILSFEEKGLGEENGWINAGVYLTHRSLIQKLPLGRNMSLEREVFPQWIGPDFCGHCAQEAVFIDIGTPQSFAQAQELFSGIHASIQR